MSIFCFVCLFFSLCTRKSAECRKTEIPLFIHGGWTMKCCCCCWVKPGFLLTLPCAHPKDDILGKYYCTCCQRPSSTMWGNHAHMKDWRTSSQVAAEPGARGRGSAVRLQRWQRGSRSQKDMERLEQLVLYSRSSLTAYCWTTWEQLYFHDKQTF